MRARALLFCAASVLASARAEAATVTPPSDGWVVWASTRSGRSEIYRCRADGTQVTQLTDAGGTTPQWSPDGRWISYWTSANEGVLMRPDGSDKRNLGAAWPGFWLHDNSGVVIASTRNGDDVYEVLDPDTGDKTPLFKRSDFSQFAGTSFLPNAITHDNRYLLVGSHRFIDGYTATNGSFKEEFSVAILDLFQKDQTYFFGNGCWPFTPPAGDLVYHICGNCPTYPDIYRMSLADLATRKSYAPAKAAPDSDWGHEYNPRVSNDNKWIAYMSSTGCHAGDDCDYEIFLHPVGGDVSDRVRVTNDDRLDAYPSLYIGPLWTKATEPRPVLTPSRLTVHALGSGLQGLRPLKLKNDGPGSVVLGTVEVEPAVAWLRAEIVGERVELSVNKDELRRGRQEAVVRVTVAGAAPIRVPVVVLADASYTPPSPDAGAPLADASSDAPITTVSNEGGCSCRVGDRGGSGGVWALLLLLAVLRRRGRA